MIIELAKQRLAEFQNRNCHECKYAVVWKVGYGEGCCTYFPVLEKGNCINREYRNDCQVKEQM